MSRVITFSRYFPKKHPKAGEPTFFVEKIWSSLPFLKAADIPAGAKEFFDNYLCEEYDMIPKYHTIRAGNRWKVGDKFSPRVWSGKPYASKQIQFAPDIEIKKIFDFECNFKQTSPVMIVNRTLFNFVSGMEVAKNDGLSLTDFVSWFNIHPKSNDGFAGQILCWNESIDY